MAQMPKFLVSFQYQMVLLSGFRNLLGKVERWVGRSSMKSCEGIPKEESEENKNRHNKENLIPDIKYEIVKKIGVLFRPDRSHGCCLQTICSNPWAWLIAPAACGYCITTQATLIQLHIPTEWKAENSKPMRRSPAPLRFGDAVQSLLLFALLITRRSVK